MPALAWLSGLIRRHDPAVLIVTQPNFPVPVVRPGAAAWVIEDTLACLPAGFAKAVALWDEAMRGVRFNRESYLHLDREALRWRLLVRFLKRWRFGTIFNELPGRYRMMLAGVWWAGITLRPGAVVVHTTRANWALAIKQAVRRVPVLMYHHNCEDHLVGSGTLRRLGAWLDGHIFVCATAERLFRAAAEEVSRGLSLRTYVVRNGVNTQLFAPDATRRGIFRRDVGVDCGTVVALYAGRILPRKGLDRVIEALGRLPATVLSRLQFWIAGGTTAEHSSDPEYRERLQRKAEAMGLGSVVRFLGHVARDRLGTVYCAADILVYPSIEPEGLPLAVLEAQACGLPVVASPVGGIPEVVSHGLNGFLLDEPGDVGSLVRWLAKLTTDQGCRVEMGRAARGRAETDFTRERMAKDFWVVMCGVASSLYTRRDAAQEGPGIRALGWPRRRPQPSGGRGRNLPS